MLGRRGAYQAPGRRRPRTGARKRGGTLPAGGFLAAGGRGPGAPCAQGPLHTAGALGRRGERKAGEFAAGCRPHVCFPAAGLSSALRYTG